MLQLAAVDSVFYCRTFFPKTFRQESPAYHRDFWRWFEDDDYDFFAAEIYRGGAKTTLTRAGLSKRIAYGISRNILVVAISEAMAIHTIRWLQKAVESNLLWASTFRLQKGSKWTDTWIEIQHLELGITINVIAKGMTSGLRGLNPDDWRPDFIFCDDISSEETVGTEDQRNKNADLFFGALVPTLAPKSEAPKRKLVLCQTGLAKDDIVNKAHSDPAFKTVRYPKLIEHPDGRMESAWPQRFSLEEVLKEKREYVQRRQLHVWLREYGCKIISRETNPFDPAWLRYWTALPTNLEFYIALDPAASKRKTAHKTACFIIGVQRASGDVFVVGYMAQQGKDPDEMWTWLLSNYRLLRPKKIGVETFAFQKFLKWYFQKQMLADKTFFVVHEIEDRRAKPDRVLQAFSGLANQGKLWVNENQTEFVQEFTQWTEDVDIDLLDAGAMAIVLANPWMAKGGNEDGSDVEEAEYEELKFEGGAP